MWKYLRLSFFHKTPVILQTETAECGLACLAMILNHHKDNSDLFTLRKRYSVSAQGASLKHLAEIASDLGMESRSLSLELNELKLLKAPCILHWEFNHFVTLIKVTDNYCVIHDPAFGRKKMTLAEVSKKFTGVAMEVYPALNSKPANERKSISFKEIFSNLTGVKDFLFKIIALSAVIEIINLLIPIGTQLIMDHVIKSEYRSLLIIIFIGLLFFYFFNLLAGLLRSWINLKLFNLTGFQWESGFFHHLLKLPLDFFGRRQAGDIQSRFSSLDTLYTTLINSIVTGLVDGIMVIAVLAMMILYGGWLTGLVLIFSFIYFLLRISTYIIYKQATEEKIIKSAKANSHFMESLYGISSVKALGIEDSRQLHWSALLINQFNADIKIKKLDMLFSAIHTFINALEQILILGFGAYAVMKNSMTLGMFVAFNSYRGTFSAKTGGMINLVFDFRILSLHIERISDIALTEKESDVCHFVSYTQIQSASLTLNNLTFQYDKFSKALFSNVSFTVRSGESVALIAPSGFGKTTLLKLMCGLLTPTSGEILFNDTDIQKLGINFYRKQIACVLQEDKLFSGSIMDNITAFSKNASQQHAIYCAALAQIHQEIMSMPMGYETLVGELGSMLSGGQKQRIFLARALYKNPKILFLDEATSHLDLQNEQKINTEIAKLNITRVIVAHRQSTVNRADRVIDLTLL